MYLICVYFFALLLCLHVLDFYWLLFLGNFLISYTNKCTHIYVYRSVHAIYYVEQYLVLVDKYI